MRGRSGQALVEFAVVVFAFLLVMFATMLAAFHAIQRAVAEMAAAAGVEVAASGTPGQVDRPDLAGAFVPTRDLLGPVMFSTAIVQVPPGQPCPPLDRIGADTVAVCAYLDGSLVAETVRGHPNLIVPAVVAERLPFSVDVTVEMHAVSYQP
ncbi:MAG TPA: hypothetical protein VKY90_21410 [Candidatus Dormibacteraeota bacterium]|nr:hypothetical protein [Candidatus Dormibacteraeota bacterium]